MANKKQLVVQLNLLYYAENKATDNKSKGFAQVVKGAYVM